MMQIFYLICVLVTLARVKAQPSSFPASGVELHHQGSSLPLYPQLTPDQVSSTDRLWCSSANNSAIASWKLPGGLILNATNPMHSGIQVSVSSSSEGTALGLFSPSGTTLPPGIYKCCITDDRGGREQILPINLVPNGARPVTSSISCTQTSTSPTRYALSFSLSNISPTSTTCMDGAGNAISGSPMITCLNDTHFGFRFEFTTVNITCDVANGPVMRSSVTVQCRTSTLTSITTPMLPSSGSQFFTGTSVIPRNDILTVTQVTASSPLWCQGSSTTDSIFWRLPDGAVLGANSSPASGAQVVTAPGQLGLTPTGSNLPSGVYTCIVNGMESFLQLIHTSGEFGPITQNGSPRCSAGSFPNVTLCAPLSQRLHTSLSCTDSNGRSACSNCFMTRIINGIVPISYETCVTFTMGAAATYTCTFSDGSNQVTVSCGLSSLPQTMITSVVRPLPGSQITISWTPITSPGLTGYNVTLRGSDGTTSTLSSGPTITTQTIGGLNPQTTYNITVTPLGDGMIMPGAPSPAVTSLPATQPDRCNPGEGFEVDITLFRDTPDINCTQLEQQNTTMLSMEALNAVLLMNNALDSNCTNPILSVRDYSCEFRDPSDSTPKSPSKKSKSKSKKPKKEKSPKGRRQRRTKSGKKSKSKYSKSLKRKPLVVSIKGRVVCNPCSVITRKRRDIIEERLIRAAVRGRIVKRKHPKKSKSKSKSKLKSKIIEEPPSIVTIRGQHFNSTATDRGREGLFCQGMIVDMGATCECPSQC